MKKPINKQALTVLLEIVLALSIVFLMVFAAYREAEKELGPQDVQAQSRTADIQDWLEGGRAYPEGVTAEDFLKS